MASSFNDKPILPPGDTQGQRDPFVSPVGSNNHHRYSNFDSQLFALSPAESPGQAKRALEAHLAETERRMAEAGKLGTALVQQQKELTDRLKEVEKLESEGELTPELRGKLTEIEKEYNDVARETARAFLPKQRVPSNETAGGSPYVPEGRGGRRSVSPSKFESQATGSPTKLSVPNRKVRNQPSNRVHDIEFAAEISTSLLAQVRNLQSLLAEKDEELRDVKTEKSRLEIETEGFQQRVKTLDESEHRYKDENWNLETQIHELIASQKDSADREKKQTQAFNILQSEKNQTQKELDEVKESLSKLAEEHETSVKQHDIELGTAKRNAALAENERGTLQKKIDELTGQNQELAKAFSIQRGRTQERDQTSGMSDEDFETATDNATPEHSPPASPVKGTPRHSMLESETLKTSLLHAQRTIQSQRSQLHREKTEKLELKRMLQDNRDELEKLRQDSGSVSNRRSRKVDSREFKKPSKGLLGGVRSSKSEIFVEDPDWEDNYNDGGVSTRHSLANVTSSGRKSTPGEYPVTTDTSDHFETSNETSDAAFETANERATETEDFQTGGEEFSGSDVETETESPSKGRAKQRPSTLNLAGNRNSFHSTASTSADEDYDFSEIKTPVAQPQQRMRLRVSRSLMNRRSRQASEEPTLQSSPVSLATSSASGTPQAPGQSLFAELAELDGSDDDSVEAGTPSRRSVRSLTPASAGRSQADSTASTPVVPPLPNLSMLDSMADPIKRDLGPAPPLSASRPVMVDSGVMTEPVDFAAPQTPTSVVHEERPTSKDTEIQAGSSPLVVGHVAEVSTPRYCDADAQHDPDMEERLPAPVLGLSAVSSLMIDPIETPEVVVPVPQLALSGVQSLQIEPIAEPEALPPSPPVLDMSTIISEAVDPVIEPEVDLPAPELAFSSIVTQLVEPIPEPEITPPASPALGLSMVMSEMVEPIAEPVVVPATPPAPPVLRLSTVMSEVVDPVAEPEFVPPSPPVLGLSSIVSEIVEPKEEPQIAQPQPPAPELAFSNMTMEEVEPRAEPPAPLPIAPVLSLSSVSAHNLEPIAEPERKIPQVPLGFSQLVAEQLEPRAEAPVAPPSLNLSNVMSEEVEPVTPPEPVLPAPEYTFSSIDAVETRPITPRSPKRNGVILDAGNDLPFALSDQPRTPTYDLFGSLVGRGKGKPVGETIIAEDETRQSPSDARQPETPESQRPFKEISSNVESRSQKKPALPMADNGAQTALTSDAIDEMLKAKRKGHEKTLSFGSSSMGTPGTVRIRRLSQDQESFESSRAMSAEPRPESPTRRPGSASSSRPPTQPLPPLPPNHKEAIEAARSNSSHGNNGVMGPPLWPASALRNQRPRTPSNNARPVTASSAKGTPTPRANRTVSGLHSPVKNSAISRQSSMSSFASEVETRFNIGDDSLGMNAAAAGFGPNSDPRMIQAITQTMIGEYLWKYTRKAGRGDLSEKRHRRYFWVHPYTRTLYWSDRDPSSTDNRGASKAKSVPIETVHVVTDDNPMPPGLHRKSLVVKAPDGRIIKFTCTTGQRHETWFNALSYLLQRTNDDGQNDTEEIAGNITQADVDEFNPQVGGQRSMSTARPLPPPSLSSYNSRATRNMSQSPALDSSMSIPTLSPQKNSQSQPQRPSIGTLGRISGYWKNSQVLSGTFSSIRSRTTSGQNQSIYEASEVHDSAEDLREMIERQDRESDRLENVRACCDGKHDVGGLHKQYHSYSKPSRRTAGHSHAGQSGSTPVSTMKSRV